MENKTIDFTAFKSNKKLHHITNDLIPKLKEFIRVSEECFFQYNFSDEQIQLRIFCITNFIRLLMSELEKRKESGEISEKSLEEYYAKIENTLKTLRKDVKELNKHRD